MDPGAAHRPSVLKAGFVVAIALFAVLAGAPAALAANTSPATPTITEPAVDGQVVNPADVHMETGPFSDPNPGDTHVCTDWEIRLASTSERVWSSPCNSVEIVHIHLGDGAFEGSHAGRTDLLFSTNYQLRARHKDSSGDPATEWSGWAQRAFATSAQPSPGTSVAWTLRQSGFQLDVFATGFQLPVNIAFVPNPGPNATDPYFYVTELYGTIRVVSRNGIVSDYVRGALNYRPSGVFPGSGEQGLTGIAVDPASGDVFASMLYESTPGGTKYAKVMRFHSNHSGAVAGSSSVILDIREAQSSSHQISNTTIGPDGKLYVHTGDGFDSSTAQNLASFRGKILRVNLDGSAPSDNPFYNASDGITARDYVFAYGFRNPFGGDWRAADGFHYEVENGPSVDRFAKVTRGTNYGWNGTDSSMSTGALYTWSPSVAPVNLAFIQSQTFGGSGFPSDKLGHAFVTDSGPTYASGPQTNGKRIDEFVLNADGTRQSGPTKLIEYTGTGRATAAGLAAGPDGLYFTDLYKDSGTSATDAGANVLRIKWVGTTPPPTNNPPAISISSPSNNSTFTAPATIPITATATDGDGTVAKVEFFQGSTKLGEDTTAGAGNQYTFSWTNVGAGSYSLTAKATDNQGASTTSSAVNVTVTSPPSGDFSISAAPSSRTVRRGQQTTYTVTITPSGGLMGNVVLSISPQLQGTTFTFAPTTVTISGSSPAMSTLTVQTSSTTPMGNRTLTIKGTYQRADGSLLSHSTAVSMHTRK
jgi:glucose/arabinose dehydrogenase